MVCGSRWLADPLVIHRQKASCVLHISRKYGHLLPNRASCLVSKVSKLTVTSFAQPVFVLGALQTHIGNFLFRWLSYSADDNTILGENKELKRSGSAALVTRSEKTWISDFLEILSTDHKSLLSSHSENFSAVFYSPRQRVAHLWSHSKQWSDVTYNRILYVMLMICLQYLVNFRQALW